MTIRSEAKRLLHWLLYRAGLFPSRWQLGNPFKIGELTYLLRDTRLLPKDRILDIGCGRGIQTQVLAQRAHSAVGVDLSKTAIDAAEKLLRMAKSSTSVKFIVGDLNDGRILPSGFDHVFSISVIEHVVNYSVLLGHAYRLLRNGGQIHVTVDSLGTIEDQQILTKHREDHSVHRYFSLTDIQENLLEAGFSDVSAYGIFVGPFARQEFSRRIDLAAEYGGSFLWKVQTYKRLMHEDKEYFGTHNGIFLIAHGVKKTNESAEVKS